MKIILESLEAVHTCNLKENKKGITLVALVITIVLLLILAGIGIQAITNTGLFGKTKQAEQKSQEKQKEENLILGQYENEIETYTINNREKEENETFKAEKLIDQPLEFDLKTPGGNWTIYNQTIKLKKSVDNFDEILFITDALDGTLYCRKTQNCFLVKDIEYNETESERTEKDFDLTCNTISAGYKSVVYDVRFWFKDNYNLFICGGGTNYSELKRIRIKSIYGLKY